MGYSHYWERPKELDQKQFINFSNDVRKIFKASMESRITLADGQGKTTEPLADDNVICFNGLGSYSHETFFLPRIFEPLKWMKPSEAGLYFHFCKTNRKPYDLTVRAVLFAFKHHFKDAIVTSDGDDDSWSPAKILCQQLLGYGLDFKLDKEITLDPVKVYGLKVIEINDLSELKDLGNVHDEN
jgi:hypothetical protein